MVGSRVLETVLVRFRILLSVYWVAVKELRLSYHDGYIYILNSRVSPI